MLCVTAAEYDSNSISNTLSNPHEDETCVCLRIRRNSKLIREGLKSIQVPFIDNDSHIIPVIIGDPLLCKKASQILLDDFQVYVQPINYPTVPKGSERLRITASPQHTPKMIKKLVKALCFVFENLNIKKAA